MALFGRKTETKKETTHKNVQTSLVISSSAVQHRDLSSVLMVPRVTEKSASQNERGMYTFVVRPNATKYDVRDAVALLFKVTPRKVTIVNRAPRTSHSRSQGRDVSVPGLKKANVFLQKGDRIDLV
jgi:large subunit ribosomal protein L23